MKYYNLLLLMLMSFAGCKSPEPNDLIVLKNGRLSASFSAYGARLTRLEVPDKNGKMTNVVWGFDRTSDYRDCKTDPYYGATIGRYGNRIAKGRFELDGKSYTLNKNDHGNSLHGGKDGFNSKDWTVAGITDSSVIFSYVSKNGEGGYPGNLRVKVTYVLLGDGLKISYEATTDKPTVINLTNHSYWNLNGPGSGNILRHVLRIRASRYTPVDSLLIPTGRLAKLDESPLDFRFGKAIGIRIYDHDAQLHNGQGYDHNYVLDSHAPNTPVAEVWGDRSGINMRVFTDQPGLQFYSGNFMAGKNTMSGGFRDNYRCGFCLETQHFPDSPNQLAFPSTVLRPFQDYRTVTIYRFSIDKQ